MKKINRLSALFDNGTTKRLVGTLTLYKERYVAFAYSDEWLENGFSISPFSLPLEKKVFIPEWNRLAAFMEFSTTVCLMARDGFWLGVCL
mgnify:CR=1 FL=1